MTLIHNLDLDDSHLLHESNKLFIKGVDRVLELCKTSRVKIFRIYFSKIDVPDSYLSKWTVEALRLNVSEFEIHTINRIRHPKLPLTMFISKSLTKFRLHHNAGSCLCNWDGPSSADLPNLKTLEIVVDYKPPDNAFKIIHGCPILENLSLEIRWQDSEQDYILRIPSLKRLKLTILKSVVYVNKVVLNVPNLEYLAVYGAFKSHFVMEDLSSLVEANVSVQVSRLWPDLLKGISKAKDLTLTIRDFCGTPVIPLLPEFPNLKQLKLDGYPYLTHTLVSRILRSTYQLEHLCIEKPKEAFSYSFPPSVFSNLKTMKYTEAVWDEYDAKLLKFILTSSKVLEIVKGDTAISLKDEVRLR